MRTEVGVGLIDRKFTDDLSWQELPLSAKVEDLYEGFTGLDFLMADSFNANRLALARAAARTQEERDALDAEKERIVNQLREQGLMLPEEETEEKAYMAAEQSHSLNDVADQAGSFIKERSEAQPSRGAGN